MAEELPPNGAQPDQPTDTMFHDAETALKQVRKARLDPAGSVAARRLGSAFPSQPSARVGGETHPRPRKAKSDRHESRHIPPAGKTRRAGVGRRVDLRRGRLWLA